MNNEFIQQKKAISSEFNQICSDNVARVIESSGDALQNLPCSMSLELFDKLFHKIQNISSNFDTDFQSDSEMQSIQAILIKAMDINTQFNKAKRVLAKVLDRLQNNSNDIKFASDNEIAEISHECLSGETTPAEFQLNEEFLYQTIIKITCQNLAIESNLFVAGSSHTLESLELLDPRLAFIARKTAFDQSISNTFNIVPENFDELVYIEALSDKSKINKLSSEKIPADHKVFVYINANPMSNLEFRKFATLLDPKNGEVGYIQEYAQELSILDIPCQIAGNDVTIQVPIFKGFVTTTIQEQ